MSGAPREEPSGGAGGIRTRDLPVANGMRCLCATAPCRSPPMRGPTGKGVIRVAALRRWCPRPDSNRRRPPPEGGALSAELRWRMPPPRDDARKRPPGRRHAHRTSGTRRPCGMAAFTSVRWCLTRVPRGCFDLCALPDGFLPSGASGIPPDYPRIHRTAEVPPVGFEPTTQGLKDPCSNH